MKVICDNVVLQEAVSIASRAVEQKNTILAMEGILLQADADLKVTGYNLKKGIYITVDADVKEKGGIVLSARLLGEIVRKLPDGMVEITSQDDGRTEIRCGQAKYNIVGINEEEYPELPEMEEGHEFLLPQKVMRDMIQQTIFAAAQNSGKPAIEGELFEVKDNTITLVAVDGFRLAVRREELEKNLSEDVREEQFIVPANALTDVVRICGETGDIEISVCKKHVFFQCDRTVVVTRRLEGPFLQYSNSIPKDFYHAIKIRREELTAAVERIAIVANVQEPAPLYFHIEGNEITLRCVTPPGKANDVCLFEGNEEPMEIGFNYKYLIDVLREAPAEEILFRYNVSSYPIVIEPAEGAKNFLYLVLPVRIRGEE